MVRRRFVNLVVADCTTGARTLHLLNAAKHLFYPSTAKAEAAHAGDTPPPRIGTLRRLPPPTMNLEGFPTTVHPWLLDDAFVLLTPRARSGGRILHTSGERGHTHTHLYDAADDESASTTTAIPTLQRRKGLDYPMLISTAGAGEEEEKKESSRVYMMINNCNDNSFEVLDLNKQPHKWEPLPLPPFAKSSNIRSFTVVGGGSTICVSTESRPTGTYCFDTRSHKWWHAGDWTLPFKGRADYIPELDTWLGFSCTLYCFDPSRLCACSDLSAMDAHREDEPKLQHVWDDLIPPSEEEFIEVMRGTVLRRNVDWYPYDQHLINLGGGRFCIAKVFQVQERISLHFEGDEREGDQFVVLSGVEVIRCQDGEEGGLRMVKHKSKRYVFTNDKIQWVLSIYITYIIGPH